MKLSEDLQYWRAERPDEWKMDEFIRIAKYLQEENAKLKKLLAEVVEAYGDRGYHGDKIFTRDHQPGIMRRVMDAVNYQGEKK